MAILFCKGVLLLRWLESPKASRNQVNEVRGLGIPWRSRVCVCDRILEK